MNDVQFDVKRLLTNACDAEFSYGLPRSSTWHASSSDEDPMPSTADLDLDLVIRLVAAAACGAALGFEREAKNKAAGLRTHMLVCLGAATFTVLGVGTAALGGREGDPVRVIQGVATGIGFLGAGQIMHTRRGIEGLTTAAAIWLAGAVGVACGIGQYPIAVAAVALGLVTLAIVQHLEGKQGQAAPAAPPIAKPKQPRAAE